MAQTPGKACVCPFPRAAHVALGGVRGRVLTQAGSAGLASREGENKGSVRAQGLRRPEPPGGASGFKVILLTPSGVRPTARLQVGHPAGPECSFLKGDIEGHRPPGVLRCPVLGPQLRYPEGH